MAEHQVHQGARVGPRRRRRRPPSASPQYAQEQLGDIMIVDVPQAGEGSRRATARPGRDRQGRVRHLRAGDGQGGRGQRGARRPPETVNADRYGEGWLIQDQAQTSRARRADGRSRLRRIREGACRHMSYHPHTPTDRREMLAVDRRQVGRRAVQGRAGAARLRQGHRACRPCRRARSRARLPAVIRQERPPRAAPFFSAPGLSPSRAGDRRLHDPARRVPDVLHALPARRSRKARCRRSVRVPDPGRALTGLEVANASMYDGSTAAAEAVLMASRITRRTQGADHLGGLHPHYRAIIETTPALGRRRHRQPPARQGRRAPIWIARSTRRPPAWSCRTPASSALSATSPSSPSLATPPARC